MRRPTRRVGMGSAFESLESRTLFATAPAGFAAELVTSGLSNPTAMDFAPDGRVFVCQQGGALRIIKNGALLATPFLSLTVDSAGERGLLGVAFDPNFATNRFVYVYHTVPAPAGGSAHNRVTRFTADAANPDVAQAGSAVPILDLDNLSGATNHNGGAIHFGPDGKLYIAVGENANGANAQTLNNRLGKMLRINPDGTIPTDNPFFNTATGANRAIWALGLRNPFTFGFEPGTGKMHINDVGETTWEEINAGQAGANYGWSIIEGPRTTQTPPPNYVDPLFAYRHPFSGADPTTVGIAITGGAFYVRPGASLATPFPDAYNGDYFFADLGSGATAGNWIRRFDTATGSSTLFVNGTSTVVDLKAGPDGALYYLERGNGGALQRVRFTVAAPTGLDLTTASDTGISQTDNLTNDDTPTFSGSAPANGTVRVYDGPNLVATGTASAAGTFSVTTPVLAPSAHVLTVTAVVGGVESASSGPLAITIDTSHPTVAASFDFQTVQRLKLQFSEDVSATLAVDDMMLSPKQSLALAVTSAAGQPTAAEFTPTATLPDGNYHATVATSDVTDAAGNALSSSVALDFFVFAGDADHNGTVDFNDLVKLAQNYNTADKTFPEGDFNYNHTVDFNDLVILAQRYNTSLPLAGVASTLSVSATSFAADWAAATAPPVVTKPDATTSKKPKSDSIFSVTPVHKPTVVKPKAPQPRRRT
jgi:glucose/arabinose dehydrogenase